MSERSCTSIIFLFLSTLPSASFSLGLTHTHSIPGQYRRVFSLSFSHSLSLYSSSHLLLLHSPSSLVIPHSLYPLVSAAARFMHVHTHTYTHSYTHSKTRRGSQMNTQTNVQTNESREREREAGVRSVAVLHLCVCLYSYAGNRVRFCCCPSLFP